MLGTAVDLDEMVAVIIVGPPFAEAKWSDYCAAIEKLSEQTKAGTRPVLLQIMRDGVEMPNARGRKMMADLRGKIRPTVVNAVVVQSPMLRMMGTALDWIRKPHYASRWFTEVNPAIRFLEQTVARPLPRIEELLLEAAAAAAAAAADAK